MSTDSNEDSVPAAPRRTARYTVLTATVVNAVFVLFVQILGLVTLAPTAFGIFSIQYLFFALASSVCLSVVCEPWLRTDVHERHRSPWRDYSSFLLYFSLTAGLITVVASLIVPELRVVALTGTLAVIASIYRSGARYYQVRLNHWKPVLWSDTAGLIVTVAGWLGSQVAGAPGLLSLSIAWALGALASAVLSPWPKVQGVSSIGEWIVMHKRHIGPLLRDSALTYLGGFGILFVIAPALGIANFGVYRAVSNVAAPVRLVLDPLRPTLAGAPLATQRSPKRVWASIGVAIAFGVAAYAALMVIGAIQIDLGSLTAVVTYAFPTALVVTANFLGLYYDIIMRAHMKGRTLLVARIVQAIISIPFPILGAVLLGLPGAIWSYAISTMCSSLTWLILILHKSQNTDPRG